jgi:hypothetical protein
MKHEFHFILNQELYFKLLKLSKRLNKDLSSTIVVAFENLKPFIEKNHLTSNEKGSKFKTLADIKEKRYHIHCYLPEYLYRRLKQIYYDLNLYSMAQILRKIIESFLMGCLKYGERDFFRKLDKINKDWENKKILYRQEKKCFSKQMSLNKNHLPYCMTNYGNDFRPYLIQLL